jgi:hypothetical protein
MRFDCQLLINAVSEKWRLVPARLKRPCLSSDWRGAISVSGDLLVQTETSLLYNIRYVRHRIPERSNPSKTQAVFYINHFCGLCGGGRYVFMEKIGGAWRVRPSFPGSYE